MDLPRIAVVVSGFPRFSETFALNEILAIHERGMLAALIATKPGDQGPYQPGVQRLIERLHVLEPGSVEQQAAALANYLSDKRLTALHAYFAHLPLQITARAARQLQLPYGFSAHARDARKASPTELRTLAREAVCAIACNHDVANQLRAGGVHVDLLPHGVDTARFQPADSHDQGPLRLLAVGRFVPKKGFEILLEALARMEHEFHLRLVGTGEGHARLEAAIKHYHLESQVELCGMKTHDELPREYAAAQVVVVPSVMDATGDRDGLPNVVLEAMACGRPIVASDVGAIGSAVVSGTTGLLVAPGDAAQLARALDLVASDRQLRQQLGIQARARVEEHWNLATCTDRFCRFLEHSYA